MGGVRTREDWARLGVVVAVAFVLIAAGCGLRVDPAPVGLTPVDGPADTADLPPAIAALSPFEAARAVSDDVGLAVARVEARPDPASSDAWEAGVAALLSAPTGPADDGVELYNALSSMDDEAVAWLAALYPDLVGNRPGVPFDVRVAANRIRVAAAIEESRGWVEPPRPWTREPRPPRAELVAIIERGQDLVYFDAHENDGRGSWIELIGDIAAADHVGVLVPGGSAFLTSDNFTRYARRAQSFVDGDARLAMFVWAAAPFPSGWIEEAFSGWAERAAVPLAAFTRDLRHQLGADVGLTLAGHSYGGAMVGLAETLPMDADRVLHVASAGAGYGIWSPVDYREPCRPRYAVMAPGDPISYVQSIPSVAGIGHGISTARLDGAVVLATGRLPDNPAALDDVGRTLGAQGLTGKEIGGIHAHSEVFIPDSDAWDNMLAVLTGEEPTVESYQPDPAPGC